MKRALGLLLLLAASARADWPHFLGPQYDNECHEKDIAAGSVNKQWSAEVGTGFSGITIANGKLFTMGNDGSQDNVVALDAASGKPLWKHGYPAAVEAASYEGGPNAAPTFDRGRVYSLGRHGRMLCLDAANGNVVWDKDAGSFNVEAPTWGFSGAPTVVGDAVVYNVGSRGAALDRNTGETLWSTSGSGAGYATPVPCAAGVALFTSAGLFALDAKSGAPAWSADWNTSFEVNAASPTPVGSGFFITTGYDTGCALVDATGRQSWRNRAMCSHFGTAAYHEGYIYGVDGNTGRRCALVCLNAADGSTAWRHESAFGTLRIADGKVFFLTESGTLLVVKATSKSYQELAKHPLLSGKCWTAPTITQKKLWARNAQGQLTCWQLEGGALTAEPLDPDRDTNLGY